MNVFEIVTEKILDELRKGVVPWKKPWRTGFAQNWESKRPYTGINLFLVPSGEYATFNQIKKAGGHIKKGEKGWLIVFWKMLDVKEEGEENGPKKKIPYLRYYNVWEINTQCEGLESKGIEYKHDPIPEAEAIVLGYENKPVIVGAGDAWYNPALDKIGCPTLNFFTKKEEYYTTMFHEMTHSTGHPSRLNRFGIESGVLRGEAYSKEELVAEMGAAILAGHCGISNETIQHSASYIHNWLNVLKGDPKMVVCAASKAQAAVNFILGRREEHATQEDE